MCYMIIDVHVHFVRTRQFGIDPERWNRSALSYAERFDVKLCAFITTEISPSPSSFKKDNRALAKLMQLYPERILGFVYVNPNFPEEAVKEIETCVNEYGMVGVKLLRSCRCNSPKLYPIAEKAIELKIPILQHAGNQHGVENRPGESYTEDVIELARKYPDLVIIMAHVAGGGDWEYEIKAIKRYKNIYLDTSGSVTDLGIIEMGVRELGAERLVFGTDGSVCESLGRIYGANITEEQRRKILYENMAKILARRGISI